MAKAAKTAKKKRARRSSSTNKSALIRDYLDANPGAKPKEIVDAHPDQGLTPSFVSTIKSNYLNKEPGATKRKTARGGGRKKAAPAASPKTRRAAATDSVSLDALVKMKSLVDQIGSVEEARSALAALEKIGKA